MALDQSLDDIISTKKQSRARGGNTRRGAGARAGGASGAAQQSGGRGGQARGGAKQGQAPAQAQTLAAVAAAAPAARLPVGDKIVVSNLPDDVTEQQVRVSTRRGSRVNVVQVRTVSSFDS